MRMASGSLNVRRSRAVSASYARMGVKELWIIDPDEKEVAVYRFDQDPADPVATLSGEMEVSSPLSPGLAITLPDIFRRG